MRNHGCCVSVETRESRATHAPQQGLDRAPRNGKINGVDDLLLTNPRPLGHKPTPRLHWWVALFLAGLATLLEEARR